MTTNENPRRQPGALEKSQLANYKLATLECLFAGCEFASALAPWGKPCPIRLPDDPSARSELFARHINGAPGELEFCPSGKPSERRRVDAVALFVFTPRSDGRCNWIGFDLDAASDAHPRGLSNPAAALRVIAERIDHAGLATGALCVHSRGGRGFHLWIVPPEPCPLTDAIAAVSMLAASAWTTATADVSDSDGGCSHAFRKADGSIAQPGESGAYELYPRDERAPDIGWCLAAPFSGAALCAKGGGVVVDPLSDPRGRIVPVELCGVPSCDSAQWARFVNDARFELARRRARLRATTPRPARYRHDRPRELSQATQDFLAGRVLKGCRNAAAFGAACNLIGCGVPDAAALAAVLDGARACGLPEREARAAYASARKRVRR